MNLILSGTIERHIHIAEGDMAGVVLNPFTGRLQPKSTGGGGGGGTVTSVSGVTDRITVTNPTTTPTVDIASTYAGQNSITTLGTVTTGVWNGATVGATFGGTGINAYDQGDIIYSSAANTLSKLAKNTNATRYLSNAGTNNNPAWAQINLSNGVTGTLAVGNGGTGLTSYTTGAILRATGATTVAGLAPSSTVGAVLRSQGTGISPSYSSSSFADAPGTDNRFMKSLSGNWVGSTYSMPSALSPNQLIISDGSGNMISVSPTSNSYFSYQSGFVFDTTNLKITASGIQVRGDLTGTTPPLGYRGERIASVIPSGSAITLSTGVAQNITSISLTAGVWDVSALAMFNGTLTGTQLAIGIGTTTNSLTGVNFGDSGSATPNMPTASSVQNLSIPQFRVVLSSTTTYYFVASAVFTAGTCTAYGRISAVRVG